MIHAVNDEGTIDGLDWRPEKSVPRNADQAASIDSVELEPCFVEMTLCS